MYSITILGAGNVASHISRHLYEKGHRISCIWSRTGEQAKALADRYSATHRHGDEKVPEGSDFYLLAIPDSAISELADRHKGYDGTWIHCAGAMGLDVLEENFKACGVLYPLQSFTRGRELNLSEVPFLIEANAEDTENEIRKLASSLSGRLVMAGSGRRLRIHLAAVFANNFTNHMVQIAARLMEAEGEDPSLLGPILKETFEKLDSMEPGEAQTGPARRGDREVMEKHMKELREHPGLEKLYTFVSQSIRDEEF